MIELTEIYIYCGSYKETGTLCSIVDYNSFCIEKMNLVISRKSDSKKACKLAAKKLRLLADKFDRLAKKNNPKNLKTQRRINERI